MEGFSSLALFSMDASGTQEGSFGRNGARAGSPSRIWRLLDPILEPVLDMPWALKLALEWALAPQGLELTLPLHLGMAPAVI